MRLDLGTLWLTALGFLLVLVLVAEAADRRWLPARLVRHPLVSALSLGVYASSWSYYGTVGYARTEGYRFLTIYLGVTLACILVPLLWAPLGRLVRTQQLSSLADVFAFRYRSQAAGVLVTGVMLVGSMPYLAQQVRAVVESVRALVPGAPPPLVAMGFCGSLTLFAVLFGARHVTPRERHSGLVLALALESGVKLVALLSVGALAVWGAFGGPGALQRWLEAHPEALRAMVEPVHDEGWGTLLLLSFAAAFLLPRQFHLAFVEARGERSLSTARWALPLFLLLLTLPLPPILWAGQVLLPGQDPDLYVVALARESGSVSLALFAFLGGVSAASAMVIVTVLALAGMCLHHLLLPFGPPAPGEDLYAALLWARRVLIGLIVLAGFGVWTVLEQRHGLAEFGLVSFVSVAQLLPGLVGVLLWPRASRRGVLAGLGVGALLWVALLVVPLLVASGVLPAALDLPARLGIGPGQSLMVSTWMSLAANALVFWGVSLAWPAGPEEREAARACIRPVALPAPGALGPASVAEFEAGLVPLLGEGPAAQEVGRALAQLGIPRDESRPGELERLRIRLERNLSGLMGPVLARALVDAGVRREPRASSAVATQLRLLDARLAEGRVRLGALEAELDAVRRYLRKLLEELPVGVCAVGPAGDVVLWNHAMEKVTGLTEPEGVALGLERLPSPWREVLQDFATAGEPHRYRVGARTPRGERRFNLHQASLGPEGRVLLVEDLTERSALEAQLAHSERLASLGRMAAGIAHEVGNPLTAVTSVVQNLQHELASGEAGLGDVQERLGLLLGQAQRIQGILRAMLTFSHAGRAGEAPEAVALERVVDEALQLVRLSPRAREVELVRALEPGLVVEAQAGRLVQVLVNLLANACDASPPYSRVQVQGARAGPWVELAVRDAGSGMPPDVRERLFEPFFTTKAPGEGTGLGLSLVYSIVREHGGEVSVESEPGQGTTVRVRLPAPDAPQAAPGGGGGTESAA